MQKSKSLNIALAKSLIGAAERDLHRRLSVGEQVDLLADNTAWPLSHIRVIVEAEEEKRK